MKIKSSQAFHITVPRKLEQALPTLVVSSERVPEYPGIGNSCREGDFGVAVGSDEK